MPKLKCNYLHPYLYKYNCNHYEIGLEKQSKQVFVHNFGYGNYISVDKTKFMEHLGLE